MLIRILVTCATSTLVVGAASFVLPLPLAVGVGVLAGFVTRYVYQARREHGAIPWIEVAIEGIPAATTACLVLWLLMR